MKIASNTIVPAVPPPSPATEVAAGAEVAASTSTATVVPAPTKTDSAALSSALAEIRALPEVDQAKVAALRTQLQNGDFPFDASKLAALIDRYHRTGQ
jgi:negative regulator of flagellin synthesis FlgM